MAIQSIDFVTLLPALVLAAGAILVLVADLLVPRGPAATGGLTVVVALAALAVLPATASRTSLCADQHCSYAVGPLSLALQGIMLVATATVALLSVVTVKDLAIPSGEHFFLLLCSAAGAVVVPATTDLVSLLIAIELVSLPTFALIGLHSSERRAGEAALKAFLFSVTSMAISLYGVALLYGSAGTVSFGQLWAFATSTPPTPVAVAGLVLLLAVIGFKVAAIPFHAWAPDAYEGAPIPVAAFLSVVSKTAGFGALTLVLATFAAWREVWAPVVAVSAALTMVIANAVALRQRGAVRLLAWSSIAQGGYILVPFGAVVAGVDGSRGLLLAVVGYLAAYAAMNLGAFAVVAIVARERPAPRICDFTGLAWRSPWLGLSLAFFLACLAGLPPGIIGLLIKVQVITVPVSTGAWWLVAAMAIATVIGLAYYLWWAAALFRRPDAEPSRDEIGGSYRTGALAMHLAVAAMVVVTVAFSVAPSLALGLFENV